MHVSECLLFIKGCIEMNESTVYLVKGLACLSYIIK